MRRFYSAISRRIEAFAVVTYFIGFCSVHYKSIVFSTLNSRIMYWSAVVFNRIAIIANRVSSEQWRNFHTHAWVTAPTSKIFREQAIARLFLSLLFCDTRWSTTAFV